MRRGGILSAALLAGLASAGFDVSVQAQRTISPISGEGAQPGKGQAPSAVDLRLQALLRSGARGVPGIGRPSRRGWSVAEDRRRATKRRNQARHRASTKGKR